jgi:glycosyltransferase involved in cell wall biosynthesis
MPARDVSVVICAYTEDRWDQICAAVGSVRAQSLPSAEIILVIDHNPPLLARATASLGDVTVVPNEQARGLSGARNTGAARARGDVIAFLDDDAAAHEDWLKFLVEPYRDPRVAGVGGHTLPRWQTARPSWLPAEFYWVIGCDYAGMAAPGTPVRNLIGANMSFSREVFRLVDGGFATGIGRTSGGRPLGCEETEFCIRLAQRAPGALLTMDHRSVIWHFVPDSRCTFRYFLARCFAEGISKAQVAASVGHGAGLSAERAYVTRTLPLGVLRGIAGPVRGDVAGVARAAAIVTGLGATAAGYLAGRRQVRRSAQRGVDRRPVDLDMAGR